MLTARTLLALRRWSIANVSTRALCFDEQTAGMMDDGSMP